MVLGFKKEKWSKNSQAIIFQVMLILKLKCNFKKKVNVRLYELERRLSPLK